MGQEEASLLQREQRCLQKEREEEQRLIKQKKESFESGEKRRLQALREERERREQLIDWDEARNFREDQRRLQDDREQNKQRRRLPCELSIAVGKVGTASKGQMKQYTDTPPSNGLHSRATICHSRG